MMTLKSARWSGVATRNGRQQLTASLCSPRFYSSTSSRTCILRSHTIPSRQQPIYQPSFKQVRSISLWGWGSSASKDADFAAQHTRSSLPNTALGHDGQMLARQVTVSSQRIPAVHQTSDYPPQPSINPEPQPIPTPLEPTFSPINEPSGSADDFSPPPADFFDPAEAFAAIPERIGYLKEVCGLDFGWGSSSLMEWMVEHIHIYGDVSWGTSIILLAILSRLVIFYPAAQSSNMAAINNAMLPVAGPIRQRMGAAWKSGDRAEIQVCKAQLSVLNKKYGFSTWKMFIPVLIQVPIQFGGFRVMRNMAELPVPALVKENWLWTQDLTLGDPYFILPVANAIIIYMTIKRGGESGNTQINNGLMLAMSYIMPGLSFLFMSFQPGAVQLYFFVTALLAFIQARLLTNATFRRVTGLLPTVPRPPTITTLDPATPSGTNTTSLVTTTTKTPASGPAGLKLYQLPSTSAFFPSTSPRISLIDRLVNRAKANMGEIKEGWYSALGTTMEEKKKKKQKEVVKDGRQGLVAAYEGRVAAEEELKRVEWNENEVVRGVKDWEKKKWKAEMRRISGEGTGKEKGWGNGRRKKKV